MRTTLLKAMYVVAYTFQDLLITAQKVISRCRFCLPSVEYPSCLQTTLASGTFHRSSHTVPCVVDTDLHPALSYISTIHQYHITIEACWGTQQRRFHLIFTPFSTPELTQSHNKLLAGIPNTTLYLLQIVPLPKNPWLHVQSKLPSVFKHWAFSSQMLILGSHSLISEKEVRAAFSTLVSHHSRILTPRAK